MDIHHLLLTWADCVPELGLHHLRLFELAVRHPLEAPRPTTLPLRKRMASPGNGGVQRRIEPIVSRTFFPRSSGSEPIPLTGLGHRLRRSRG
jgi:hypothetical protein